MVTILWIIVIILLLSDIKIKYGRCSCHQKTVAEMSMDELTLLRGRIYAQKRTSKDPRLDIQLHAVHGELKDRGYITKAQREMLENDEDIKTA